MTALVAFIVSYLGAAFFLIAGGVPFTPMVVLWINFLIQVPIAIALGYDDPSPGLMDRKPRPLSQPVLSRTQWVRIAFVGILMALATLVLETVYAPQGVEIASTMGFVIFSLFNIVIGLSSRSETETVFNREILHDRRQLGLFGLAFLLMLLPTEIGFLSNRLELTSLAGDYRWLICIGFAVALLLVTEVIKVFLRRSKSSVTSATPAATAPAASSG